MMARDFQDWDAGLHRKDPNSLEQSGIKGMKWGVRRYQNTDGSLTEAGKARYGYGSGEGQKRTSAKKMTKDFNSLDRGYANIEASRRYNMSKTSKYARKGHALQRKGKTEKGQKLIEKSLGYAKKAALNNQQKKAVEGLQWKIIGKAATKGYTTTSTAVTRSGKSHRRSTSVDGQEVSIKKRGNGGTNVINYANANKFNEEERRRARAKQLAGVRR